VLTQLFKILEVVVKSPLTSIFVGAILAFGGRHVIYGIGLALILYGVLALLSAWLGFKLVP